MPVPGAWVWGGMVHGAVVPAFTERVAPGVRAGALPPCPRRTYRTGAGPGPAASGPGSHAGASAGRAPFSLTLWWLVVPPYAG